MTPPEICRLSDFVSRWPAFHHVEVIMYRQLFAEVGIVELRISDLTTSVEFDRLVERVEVEAVLDAAYNSLLARFHYQRLQHPIIPN